MRKAVLVVLLALVLLLVSCTPAEKLEILGVDFGTAEILAGNTTVVVSHSLGVVPENVLLTLSDNPSITVTYWATNVTAISFNIETNNVSGSDMHFYWRVEK